MLEAIRIVLTAYTASFRVPHFVGYQLTLPVPPLSTIYGLISTAAGRWVTPEDVEWLAYRCEYEGKGMDTEAIWTVERNKPGNLPRFETRNIVQREFLTLPCLTLYLPSKWGETFRRPRYPLLLGRTQDVATVEEAELTNLEPVSAGEVGGVLLPYELVARGRVSAWLQNLPVAFTDESRRRHIRPPRIFGVVDALRSGAVQDSGGWLVRDVSSGLVLPLFRREWVLSYGQR